MCKRSSSRSSSRPLVAAAVSMALLVGFATVGSPRAAEPAKVGVTQTIHPDAQVVSAAPPLHLSDAQRTRISEVLKKQDTEIEATLKKTKSAKSFEPGIDKKLPAALKGQAFPRPLITEMPEVRQYTYIKFKGQVLIINPMTHKIVDMFPQQSS